MRIVFVGLSITSSWGNGHATTYRGLCRELTARGHEVWFLERDVPWYAAERDMPDPDFCITRLYESVDELQELYAREVEQADAVIVGSYVPDGVEVGEWVTHTANGVKAFYDIDTPVTLSKLEKGEREYLTPALIPQFDLYLSFTGGPTLGLLEKVYGARNARPLYCSFDPALYYREKVERLYDLAYMGTYSDDRQPTVQRLLMEAAYQWPEGKFAVVGPQYPDTIEWPPNVVRIEHLPPSEHRHFYNSQRFTLNVTREDMIRAGYSPSVRLFEAAACATPIISDYWPGLETFFKLGEEVLVAQHSGQVTSYLQMSEEQAEEIGHRARKRALREHTAAHRAETLEGYLTEVLSGRKSVQNGVLL